MASPLLSLIIFFSRKNPVLFLRLPHHSPHGLSALYLHSAYRKTVFGCQTSRLGCTSRRKPPAPDFLLPAFLFGADKPVLLHRIALDRSPGACSRSPAYSFRVASSSAEYFCSCSSSRFRFCSMAAMSFGKFIGGIFLGICQRDSQKQILFRTQFLHRSSVSAAILVASSWVSGKHMDSRE